MSFFRRFIYNNFLRPSRLLLYNDNMQRLVDAGYVFYTIDELNQDIIHNRINSRLHEKICVIRHDIDTDPKTAALLSKIENKYGIHSTYYFRWRTANKKYMDMIASNGNEVSYHYEELGTYSMMHKLKTRDDVERNIDDIQKIFLSNLLVFKKRFGLSCSTIAAHGDWCCYNYLKISNSYLVDDKVRAEGNISLEAYDKSFMDYVSCRISDLGGADIWKPISLKKAIDQNEPFIYILIHPRQWYTRIGENIKEDCYRLIETVKYIL